MYVCVSGLGVCTRSIRSLDLMPSVGSLVLGMGLELLEELSVTSAPSPSMFCGLVPLRAESIHLAVFRVSRGALQGPQYHGEQNLPDVTKDGLGSKHLQ